MEFETPAGLIVRLAETRDYSPVLGNGKEPELDAARRSACWAEATDKQLLLPKPELEQLLATRLPALMAEFKAAIEQLGFVY